METEDVVLMFDMDVHDMLSEYQYILNQPIEYSFVDERCLCQELLARKEQVITRFHELVSRYVKIEEIIDSSSSLLPTATTTNNMIIADLNRDRDVVPSSSPSSLTSSSYCSGCGRLLIDFEIINYEVVVCACGCENSAPKESTSYRDIDRVTISGKYVYDRRVHFRECLAQYQGKENCTVAPEVIDALIEQFKHHNLLIASDDEKEKFKNITKKHVSMFLKELGISKHYDNVNLIHSLITGVPADDISHLENALMEDFVTLTDLYERKFRNDTRKNFINTEYVLYQLLIKYKHKCRADDVAVFKSADRKLNHDDICRTLFEELGWNF
jgi:hypothetical protein